MKTNMSSQDKSIRIVAAALIFILFFEKFIGGALGIILLIAAGILVFTGMVGFCPLYKLLGISSKKKSSEKSKINE